MDDQDRQRTEIGGRNSANKRRSVMLGGRRTSVTLEDEFWTALLDLAERSGISADTLVEQIDAGRNTVNLSSAIRVFVFRHYRKA